MNSEVPCAKCGAHNPGSSQFCSLCFARLNTYTPAAPAAVGTQVSPGHVVPFPDQAYKPVPERALEPLVPDGIPVASEPFAPATIPVAFEPFAPAAAPVGLEPLASVATPVGHDPFPHAYDAELANVDVQQVYRKPTEYQSVFSALAVDTIQVPNGHHNGIEAPAPVYETATQPEPFEGLVPVGQVDSPTIDEWDAPLPFETVGYVEPDQAVHESIQEPSVHHEAYTPVFQIPPQTASPEETSSGDFGPVIQFPASPYANGFPPPSQEVTLAVAPVVEQPQIAPPREIATQSESFAVTFDPSFEPTYESEAEDIDSLAVRWPWKYLVAFLAAAFIIPLTLALFIVPNVSIKAASNAAFTIQIFGYLAAIAVAAAIVKQRGDRNWAAFGLRREQNSLDHALWGAGFGLVIFAVWTPIGLLLNGGRFGLDAMIRSIVGESSAIGLVLAGMVVVVGAPLIEEIYFRSMLFAKIFARFGKWAALIGTTVIFTAVHGSLIIIPILIMGFALAWKRLTRPLWYTIGAHAAWNLVVMSLGAYLVLGPPATFTSDDGAYSVRHRLVWERAEDMEIKGPEGGIDLALSNPRGSYIELGHVNLLPMNPDEVLPAVLQTATTDSFEGITAQPGTPTKTSRIFDGFPIVWEVQSEGVHDDVGKIKTHAVAAMHAGSGTMYIFSMACAVRDCGYANEEFESILKSFSLNR